MIKIINPASWDFNEQIASVVDTSSRGIDSSYLEKRAAAGVFKHMDLKPDKGHSLIHLIALGDGEVYGCFVAGTPVLNGALEFQSIETFRVGDKVITDKARARRVSTVYVKHFNGNLLEIRTHLNLTDPVVCTPCHKILRVKAGDDIETAEPELVKAEDLCVEDYLLIPHVANKLTTDDTHTVYRYVPILSINRTPFSGAVYDLEVEQDHKYLVNAGFIVSNSNRNGDVFYSSGRKLEIPEPNWDRVWCCGEKTADAHGNVKYDNGYWQPRNEHKMVDGKMQVVSNFADCTSVGNKDQYSTFTKYANVYKDHKNKPYERPDPEDVRAKKENPRILPPDKIYGSVKAAVHNPQMGRVELMIQVPHGKDWDADLEKLANGNDIPWSMAAKCMFDVCFPAETLLTTPAGLKPIASLAVGATVVSHTGAVRKVTSVMDYAFTGTMTELTVLGIPNTIKLTHNHPILLLRAAELRNCWGTVKGLKRKHTLRNGGSVCSTCHVAVRPQRVWEAAEHANVGDYAVHPIKSPGKIKLDAAFAYLAGQYTGDGSIVYIKRKGVSGLKRVPAGIALSLSPDTAIRDKVIQAAEFLLGKTIKAYSAGTTKEGVIKQGYVINIRHAELARFCLRFIGTGSHYKRLRRRIFSLDTDSRQHFLAGCFDSDGSINAYSVRYNSVSLQLASDIQQLLWGLRIPATVNEGHANSSFSSEPVKYYTVCFSVNHADIFKDKAVKAYKIQPRKYQQSQIIFIDDDVYLPIKETRSYYDEIQVYNISVAVDETYIAGIAVHNCHTCGHKAERPEQYCEHLAKNITGLTKSGHMHSAVNDCYAFFDISRVGRPADRIAWSLYHAANHASPFEKTASYGGGALWDEAEYVPALQRSPYNQGSSNRFALVTKAAALEKIVPAIAKGNSKIIKGTGGPNKDIPHVKVAKYELPDFFRALADNGVCLPLTKWAEVVLGDNYESLKVSVNDAQKSLINAYNNIGQCAALNTVYDASVTLPQRHLVKLASDLTRYYGVLPDAVGARAAYNVICDYKPSVGLVKEASVTGDNPVAADLAKNYLSYQLSFLDQVSRTHQNDMDFIIQATVLQNYI